MRIEAMEWWLVLALAALVGVNEWDKWKTRQ
jgi:hypothetical protein